MRAYAERKQVPGVFAVRAPGAAWTGTTRNLATAQKLQGQNTPLSSPANIARLRAM
ncbi:MAG: hypothetical protein WDM91_21490 [Rhizomicrobium sp.]